MRLGPVPLIFTLGIAFCQEHPDPSGYSFFFSQISDLKSSSDRSLTVASNDGGLKVISFPKVQDVIGLTNTEADLLNKVSADFVAAIDNLESARHDLIFESRLEFIETGTHSDALAQKLKNVDDQEAQLALKGVRQLKSSLPEASFAKIDTYVHTPLSDRKSLTTPLGVPIEVPAKKK